MIGEATVAKRGSPGRVRISRKTTAQGRPECLRLYLWSSRSRKFLLRGGPGCSGHPVFPAPSVVEEGDCDAKLGRNAPREGGLMSLHSSCPAKADPVTRVAHCRHTTRAAGYWIAFAGDDSGMSVCLKIASGWLLHATLSVVPAQAGTHNPRERLLRRKVDWRLAPRRDSAVWVPACAGTTVVLLPSSQTSSFASRLLASPRYFLRLAVAVAAVASTTLSTSSRQRKISIASTG